MPKYEISAQAKIDALMAEIRKYFTIEQVHSLNFDDKGNFIDCEISEALTTDQKNLLAKILRKFWDIDDYDPLKIRDFTASQIDNYIETNVTDLASAKRMLKILAKVLLFLYKRLERD